MSFGNDFAIPETTPAGKVQGRESFPRLAAAATPIATGASSSTAPITPAAAHDGTGGAIAEFAVTLTPLSAVSQKARFETGSETTVRGNGGGSGSNNGVVECDGGHFAAPTSKCNEAALTADNTNNDGNAAAAATDDDDDDDDDEYDLQAIREGRSAKFNAAKERAERRRRNGNVTISRSIGGFAAQR